MLLNQLPLPSLRLLYCYAKVLSRLSTTASVHSVKLRLFLLSIMARQLWPALSRASSWQFQGRSEHNHLTLAHAVCSPLVDVHSLHRALCRRLSTPPLNCHVG